MQAPLVVVVVVVVVVVLILHKCKLCKLF